MEGPDLFEEEEGENDEDGGNSHEANVEEYKDGGEGEDNSGRDGGKAGDEPDGTFPSVMIQEDLSTVAFYPIFKPRVGRRSFCE